MSANLILSLFKHIRLLPCLICTSVAPAGRGHCYSSSSPSSGHTYLLHNTLRDMDVLHGDNRCQFIQAVDILDLVQELHTAETNGTRRVINVKYKAAALSKFYLLNKDSLESLHRFLCFKKAHFIFLTTSLAQCTRLWSLLYSSNDQSKA